MKPKFYVDWHLPTSHEAKDFAGFDTFDEAIAWLNAKGPGGGYMSDELLNDDQVVALALYFKRNVWK